MKKCLLSLMVILTLSGYAFAGKAEDLRYYVGYNQPAKVEECLAKGYDVNSVTTDGFTPLMIAAEQNLEDMVALLLKHGADPSLKSDRGKKAIDYTSSRTIQNMLAKAEGITFPPAAAAPPKAPAQAPAKAPAKTAPAAKPAVSDHCKTMYGKTYMLCDRSDYSCKIKAANDYKSCQKKGTWY